MPEPGPSDSLKPSKIHEKKNCGLTLESVYLSERKTAVKGTPRAQCRVNGRDTRVVKLYPRNRE